MSGPHSSGDPGVPEYLLDSVSLISKKWHPPTTRRLSENDVLGSSDIERQLETVSQKVPTERSGELYRSTEALIVSAGDPCRLILSTVPSTGRTSSIDSLASRGENHLAEHESEQVVLVADAPAEIREFITERSTQ
jgi:hypothetical protein